MGSGEVADFAVRRDHGAVRTVLLRQPLHHRVGLLSLFGIDDLKTLAPFGPLDRVPDPNWQGLAGKSMEHDQKLTVSSPTRFRTYLPLVALLALWLPTSSSEATFKSPDALRVASAKSGPTHLVAAKSRQRSA